MQASRLQPNIPIVCLAITLATPAMTLGQCCQKSAAQKETSPGSAPVTASGTSNPAAETVAANRAEWLVHAARRISEEVSRLVEKVTYADYSTQWSSWCAGNRGGSSQPCAPKCCEKPAGGKPQTPETPCCQKPCPPQSAQTSQKVKGS